MPTQLSAADVDVTTVREIMTRDVRTVAPETTVADLIQVLTHEQITGVPVVTDAGQLRGVVSMTDVLRLAADAPLDTIEENVWGEAWEEDASEDETATSYFTEMGARGIRFGAALPGPLDEHAVADIMTPATFTVREDATIRELARFLARGRIHRALVVDRGRLVGIATAFDVVRAIAGSV